MAFVEPAHGGHEPDGAGRGGQLRAQLGARPDQDSRHARRLRETGAARMPKMPIDDRIRCSWAGTDPLNVAHHDLECGVPSRDRRHLFELLTLEAAA